MTTHDDVNETGTSVPPLPAPDENGNPRPPAAPGIGTSGFPHRVEPTPSSYGPGRPAVRRYQFGPDGEPALELVAQPRLARWQEAAPVGAVQAALLLVLVVGVDVVFGVGVSWWGWIVLGVLLVVAATARQVRNSPPPGPIVAGAWWVGTDHRHCVRTYQLVHVGQGLLGNTPWLLLTDARGRTMLLDCALAQAHPPLWALVHHGIRHSAVHGAEIDDVTRQRLFGGSEPSG